MCLFTKRITSRYSPYPIICYKVFVQTKVGKIIRTPFQGDVVAISIKTLQHRTLIAKGNPAPSLTPHGYAFGSGWIHAYTQKDITQIKPYLHDCDILCECEIPPNTPYLLSDRGPYICAERMIVKRILQYPVIEKESLFYTIKNLIKHMFK